MRLPSSVTGRFGREASLPLTAATAFISQVTPIALQNIGWRYYILYIVCNLINALTFWAFLPETAGIPLEETDQLFGESPVFVPFSKGRTREVEGKTELERRTEKQEAMLRDGTLIEVKSDSHV